MWSSDEEGDSDDETIQKKKTAKQVRLYDLARLATVWTVTKREPLNDCFADLSQIFSPHCSNRFNYLQTM